MTWKDTPIHIIDFEGTHASGIIEYGVITLLNGTISKAYTRICPPYGTIASEDTAIHGISMADTEGYLPFTHEWNLFSKLRQTGLLCAHHAQTEHSLLKRVWPYPSKSPDFMEAGHFNTTWDPWVDTYQLYRSLYPHLHSHKLMSLIKTFYLEKELYELSMKHCPKSRQKPHCALFDAIASALLLTFLSRLTDFKNMTIPWLLTQSATNPKRAEALQQLSLGLS